MPEPIIIGHATLYLGDCLERMRELAEASIDAIVTDPPYGLSFMGRHWDYDVPGVDVWREALRVLKPGGHLLSFSSARTYHRAVVAIEDAGFEIRDQIMWVYGSGFPKSLDVSKALDRMAGAEREVVGMHPHVEKYHLHGQTAGQQETIYQGGINGAANGGRMITAPATEAARQWSGWGTALKPAHEPICLARKPLAGTVAKNVLAHGTGAMNVDGCRVETAEWDSQAMQRCNTPGSGQFKSAKHYGERVYELGYAGKEKPFDTTAGRWPANLIHDGSDDVVGLFPETEPARACKRNPNGKKNTIAFGDYGALPDAVSGYDDNGGSAARFFYTAKAQASDRDEGCEGLEPKARPTHSGGIGNQPDQQRANNSNHHPTVKPVDLMRYLCRLITPPGGLILDPYMGSGSTGKGAMLEGFRFIGIEREAEYLDIAAARIRHAQRQPDMFHVAA